MITLLTGENTFETSEAVKALVGAFDGRAEQIDGSALELKSLPDLLMGGTLFAEQRLVIIKDLSQNSTVWEKLPEWLPRISDDIHVVLVDAKPDKRTTAYKAVKAAATVQEYAVWSDRDTGKAELWSMQRAKHAGVDLDAKLARYLVARVGVDQWLLASAIDKLALLDEVTQAMLEESIDANPSENIFQLFETALSGRRDKVAEALRTLELQEDPYATFALLSSQVFSLAAVAFDTEGRAVKEFAIHPYVASKLTTQAKRLGKKNVADIVHIFAQTDADMKRSKAEPWLLIERTLYSLPI